MAKHRAASKKATSSRSRSARAPAPKPPSPRSRGPSPTPRRAGASKTASDGRERLQKVLAHAGLGSRRACEELILQGRVTVDGQTVRELGTRVDPRRQKIEVDGEAVRPERPVYYAVHKPKGYVSTNLDPSGRPRVVDLLPEIPQRVYTVGRLDESSTGLMILTNDGDLAHRLAHPRYGVEKVYRAVVAGHVGPEVLTKIIEGVWLAEGKARAKRARVVGKQGDATVLEMVLAEGKNREVRRILAKLGHKVMSLTRTAVGPITLKGLAEGACRPLTAPEVSRLRQTIEALRGASAGPGTKGPRKPARSPSRGRPRPSKPPAEPTEIEVDPSRLYEDVAAATPRRPPRGGRRPPPAAPAPGALPPRRRILGLNEPPGPQGRPPRKPKKGGPRPPSKRRPKGLPPRRRPGRAVPGAD